VATALFLLLFFFVALFAVDVTRFYLLQRKTQDIADQATLAAADALNQVVVLKNLDRSRVVREAYRFVSQRRGYDEDLFEIRADLSRGDVQAAEFQPRPPDRADTYYRIGLNVKHAFEPYFLPRRIFGDQPRPIQAQAVAEIVPVFSVSNLFDPFEPGDPIPPLRHAIYSKLDIKTEDFGDAGCLTVNGSLHADSGYIKMERMDDPDGCGAGRGTLRIRGDPGAGCIVFEDVAGTLEGDLIYRTGIVSSNGPVETGHRIHADPGPEELVVPPTPGEDPGQYPGPVCVVEGDRTVGSADALVGREGTDCSGGGTFYVRGGNLTVNDFSPEGSYSLVADGSITLHGAGSVGTTQLFVYAIHGWIKVEDIRDDLTVRGSFYAPAPGAGGLCNPVQPGCIKFEDARQHDVTVNGSLVSGTLTKFENVRRLTVNYEDHQDRLPGDLRESTRKNRIPDYWKIHLIH